MSAADDKLRLNRLDGDTISAGCWSCPLLKQCGGYTRRGGGWSCMDRCAGCDKSKCSVVCMKKPADFARAILEVGGFHFRDIPSLVGSAALMPRYAPVVQHPLDRIVPLEWAAIPLHVLMHFERQAYVPRGMTPESLRTVFGLAPSTKIILVGTGKDRGIETYWRMHRVGDVASALARLGISVAIAPNYSMFLEDPRPQHMHNRKRSLLIAKSWSLAGLAVAICQQAVTRADWEFHESFLRAHPEVSQVALEFQTGLARSERAEFAFENLARIQDRLGRKLHLFAIGASRYRAVLPKRFDSFTILDSMPFMKAMKRRAAATIGRRVAWERALGEEVPNLVLHNVSRYMDWLGMAESTGPATARR